MVLCKDCKLGFPDTTSLKSHHIEKHATILKYKIGSVEYVSQMGNDHSFPCNCHFHVSPARYSTGPLLVAHVDRMRKWQSEPPAVCFLYQDGSPLTFFIQENTMLVSEHLIDSQTLTRYSLMINAKVKLLLCLACRGMVTPSRLASHINKHKTSLTVEDREKLEQLCAYFDVTDAIPNTDVEWTTEIEGLRVEDGLRCSHCTSVFIHLDSVRSHHNKKHAGLTFSRDLNSVTMQRLHSGSACFAVVPAGELPQRTSDDEIIQSISQWMEATRYKGAVASDMRNISPWLRYTGWHALLEDREVKDLLLLAQPPSLTDFPTLSDAVHHLFSLASDLIEKTPLLIRQFIHSPNPSQEYVQESLVLLSAHISPRVTNMPFKKLQDHEKLIKAYATPVVGLVAMLLRQSPVPLPDNILLAIETLRTVLSTEPAQGASEHVLALLALLWQHKWLPDASLPLTDPTIAYLGLSSLQDSGQFNEPKLVTSPIARFKYCIRLMFLSLMHREETMDDGLARYQPWLVEKVESTFNSLCSLQHVASSIAYSTMSLPSVWWQDRKTYKTMLYKGSSISIDQISVMIQNLEERTKTTWEDLILLQTGLQVEYTLLHDDLSNKNIGYSFVTDPRNQCFSDDFLLLKAILASEHLRSRFLLFNQGGVSRWNTHALRKWLLGYAEFHLLQLVRCQLTAGSPSRGTELTAMLACNTQLYSVRNLVAFGKHISLLCTYLKTSSMSGADKLIPHSLDAFTSDLLVQDFAIARPFARFAARVVYPNQPEVQRLFERHVFVNHTKLFETKDITLALNIASAPHLGMEIGVNSWRHMSTAFRRKLCPRLQELLLLDEKEENDVQALQMGHTLQTEKRVYGLSADALAGASEDVLPLFLDASTDWQVALSVVPGGLGIPYAAARMGSFSTLLQQGIVLDTRKTTNLSLPEIMAYLEKLEIKMDAYFAGRHPTESRQEPILPPCLPTPNQTTPDTEALALEVLRRLLHNPTASWKTSEQRAGVLAALECKRDVLAVLPTGSGKSMLAIIPHLLEPNLVTVVILPLRVLMKDYITKLNVMGVAFQSFDSNRMLTGSANLVLVSADSVMSNGWKQAIVQMNERMRVARQIVDEAHIPTTSHDYRPILEYMSDIRTVLPCQIILLTATGSRALERAMMGHYALGPTTLVLRSVTNRPELCYRWSYPATEEDSVQQLRATLDKALVHSQDRAIIFVPWIELGASLSTELGLPFYHGGRDLSDRDRDQIYDEWTLGQPNTVIATGAFGTGNDNPHVRCVIHLGTPYELINYIQEVSRAGRDGKKALCLLLASPSTSKRKTPQQSDEPDLVGREAMGTAVRNPVQCIRHLVTFFVDGRGIFCSSFPLNELCSVCESNKNAYVTIIIIIIVCPPKSNRHIHQPAEEFEASTYAAKRQKIERLVQTSSYVDSFLNHLSTYQKVCTLCLIYGVNSSHHTINLCSTLLTRVQPFNFGTYAQWRRGIKYNRLYHNRICFMCHVPQGDGDVLHPTFTSDSKSCPYPDLIAPLVYAILIHPPISQKAQASFPKANFSSPGLALAWINAKPDSEHESNLIALFFWYANNISGPVIPSDVITGNAK